MGNFRRRYFRKNNYGGRNHRRNSFGGRKRCQININQLISKAVCEEVPSIYASEHTFAEFDLAESLKRNILEKKYVKPTKIQYETIPQILKGRDILGTANTGSGKTAAFLIPMINKSILDGRQRFLIVVPTRELATQIQDELRDLSKGMNIRTVLVIGGNSMGKQMSILRKNPQFVIATPGRLKDLVQRKAIDLSRINNIVLDEVDRMLDMGFITDIKFIISRLSVNRQSLFFSATMNKKTREIANTFLKNPVHVETERQSPARNVDQDVIRLKGNETKFKVLCDYVCKDEFKKVLIFTRTKRETENLSKKFSGVGIKSNALHGDKRQSQRTRIISAFKDDSIMILIATDVASRGLDIQDITHVINYDVPENYDDYIHRIGRTGRAGKKGCALTFV